MQDRYNEYTCSVSGETVKGYCCDSVTFGLHQCPVCLSYVRKEYIEKDWFVNYRILEAIKYLKQIVTNDIIPSGIDWYNYDGSIHSIKVIQKRFNELSQELKFDVWGYPITALMELGGSIFSVLDDIEQEYSRLSIDFNGVYRCPKCQKL